MTVKEVIEKLKNFDPDDNVYFLYSDDNPYVGGSVFGDIFRIDGSSDETVNGVYFLEG